MCSPRSTQRSLPARSKRLNNTDLEGRCHLTALFDFARSLSHSKKIKKYILNDLLIVQCFDKEHL